MKQNAKEVAAFTLVELLIVIMVISIIAGYSFPNYTRSIHRARARDAINNLRDIRAAQMIYRSLNTSFSTLNDVAAINRIIGANSMYVIGNGVTYSCNDSDPPTVCTGVSPDFTVTVTLTSPINPGTNPACVAITAGSCP